MAVLDVHVTLEHPKQQRIVGDNPSIVDCDAVLYKNVATVSKRPPPILRVAVIRRDC